METHLVTISGEKAEKRREMKIRLSHLWDKWKPIARKIGDFQARMLLAVLYGVVIAPLGLLIRIVSDPLGLRARRRDSYWIPRDEADTSLQAAGRQY